MNEILHKRVMPASVLAAVLLTALLLIQLFLVFGGLETKTSSFRKAVPWLYKPFLRLVGEHPSTRPDWLGAEGERQVDEQPQSAVEMIAGFAPSELSVELDAEEAGEDESGADQKVTEPVAIPDVQPAEIIDEDIPVG